MIKDKAGDVRLDLRRSSQRYRGHHVVSVHYVDGLVRVLSRDDFAGRLDKVADSNGSGWPGAIHFDAFNHQSDHFTNKTSHIGGIATLFTAENALKRIVLGLAVAGVQDQGSFPIARSPNAREVNGHDSLSAAEVNVVEVALVDV
jgi:hypothetical protein